MSGVVDDYGKPIGLRDDQGKYLFMMSLSSASGPVGPDRFH